jgi:hypothetical protein
MESCPTDMLSVFGQSVHFSLTLQPPRSDNAARWTSPSSSDCRPPWLSNQTCTSESYCFSCPHPKKSIDAYFATILAGNQSNQPHISPSCCFSRLHSRKSIDAYFTTILAGNQSNQPHISQSCCFNRLHSRKSIDAYFATILPHKPHGYLQ